MVQNDKLPAPQATLYPTGTSSPPKEEHHIHPFHGLVSTRRSRKKVWAVLLFRWLVTLVFIAVVYILLVGYSRRTVLDRNQKREFNALFVGCSIVLALITVSHLNKIVADLRWWILSRRFRSSRKVKAILRAQSVSHLVYLASHSKRWTVHLGVAIWVILLVGSQVGYAAVGLCFSIEKTEDMALIHYGNITIPDLDKFQTQRVIKASDSLKAQQYTANSYGTISLAFSQGNDSHIPKMGTLWWQDDVLMFCNDDSPSCSYIFHEVNTDSLANGDAIPIEVTTNRSVSVTTSCTSYKVIRGADGTQANFTIEVDSKESVIPFPAQGGLDQSTFMTDYSKNCGEYCSIVTAFEASSDGSWYYNCTTWQNPIQNANLPEHQISPNVSRLATSAIALQGYVNPAAAGPILLTGAQAEATKNMQYNSYPAVAIFGTPLNGTSKYMETVLSRFAIGVIAVAAEANEGKTVMGDLPEIGQKLKVEHWDMVHLIFALTAGLQLLLAVIATYLAERVVVPTGGPVAEAQVLRQMTNRGRPGDGSEWKYMCVDVGEKGMYDLFMEQKGEESDVSGEQQREDNEKGEVQDTEGVSPMETRDADAGASAQHDGTAAVATATVMPENDRRVESNRDDVEGRGTVTEE